MVFNHLGLDVPVVSEGGTSVARSSIGGNWRMKGGEGQSFIQSSNFFFFERKKLESCSHTNIQTKRGRKLVRPNRLGGSSTDRVSQGDTRKSQYEAQEGCLFHVDSRGVNRGLT